MNSAQPESKLTWSILLLVLANLIPVFGVLLWDWDIFYLMFVFWCENVIIGIYGIAKIVVSGEGFANRVFLPVFFSVHYGGFMAGHILFLTSLFLADADKVDGSIVATLTVVLNKVGWLAILALFISHGWSFINNFLATEERHHLTPQQAMAAPYKRMVVTHVAIIASGFLVTKLGEPLVGLLMLVAMKVALDVFFHRREHASSYTDVN